MEDQGAAPAPAPTPPTGINPAGPVARAQRKARKKTKKAYAQRARKAAAAPQATREQLLEIEHRMVTGWTPTKVADHYSVLWNHPYQTVLSWVRLVEQKWLDDAKAQGQEARHEWVIRQMKEYVEFARRLADEGNYELMKCVPNMMERIAKATGAYHAQEVKVSVSGGINVGEMSDDLVKNRIMELLAKHGDQLPGDPGDGRKHRKQ